MCWHLFEHSGGWRGRVAAWRDLLAASDPGLNRLLAAVEVMVSITVTIAAVYGFMQLTNVMWVHPPSGHVPSPAQLALLAAQHHGVTELAMLLGGLIALLTTFAVLDPHPRGQALTMSLMPIPLIATMALSIQLVTHRTAGIALLAVVMGITTYLRKFVPRFGTRVVLYGILLFIGFMFGFLSAGAITEHEIGWIAVIAWLAVLVNLLLKVLVYRPLDRGRVRRTARAFRARARAVAAAAAELYGAAVPSDQATRRLHNQLVRLNGTALVIDASITAPTALSQGVLPLDAHTHLFELERRIHNIARLAERLAARELPPQARREVRAWLSDLRTGRSDRAARAIPALGRTSGPVSLAGVADTDTAAIHQLAREVVAVASTLTAPTPHRSSQDSDHAPFQSAVTLIAGDLPGSALVGARAAARAGHRGALLQRLRLDAPAQAAIRVILAVAVASALGSLASERRFYWAVIAVFVAFMGTNTSGEQVIKTIHRVAGTIAGILIGSLLANAIGHSTWSLAVIVGALGLGAYFIKVSYATFVIGLTVALAQLYSQLGEYSNHLLVVRLEETAIGGAVAIIAALVVFPVGTRRAARIAEHAYLDSLADLLGRLIDRLRSRPEDAPLSSASRALDHAHQQLLATARPLARNPLRRDPIEHTLPLFTRTTNHARNFVAELAAHSPLDAREADRLATAIAERREAVLELADGLENGRDVGDLLQLDDAFLGMPDQQPDDPGALCAPGCSELSMSAESCRTCSSPRPRAH
jgi:Fusaric acid resistance protein-like